MELRPQGRTTLVHRRVHIPGGRRLALSQATDNILIGIFGLTVGAMGLSARQAPFWSVSSSLLAGTSSAVAIAVISSFGQLGGFVGPYIVGFLTDRTRTYAAGTFYLIGSAAIAAVLMLTIDHDFELKLG